MASEMRPGTKFVPLPPGVGHIVSMCIFHEELYVAFQFGVFRKRSDDSWEKIIAVGPKEGTAYDARAHERCYP